MNQRFLIFLVSSLFVFANTSCNAKNAGANLGISVSPERSYIVDGKGTSCVSKAAAKADDTVAIPDVDGEQVLFSQFKIQWRSGDQLTISAIKVTMYGDGIEGGTSEDGVSSTLDEAEMAALLGLEDLKIAMSSPYDSTRIVNVDSTDLAIKGPTKPYAPCGLQIGGLKSVKGARNYSVRVKVEVVGFSTDPTGNQSPVRQSTIVRAERF